MGPGSVHNMQRWEFLLLKRRPDRLAQKGSSVETQIINWWLNPVFCSATKVVQPIQGLWSSGKYLVMCLYGLHMCAYQGTCGRPERLLDMDAHEAGPKDDILMKMWLVSVVFVSMTTQRQDLQSFTHSYSAKKNNNSQKHRNSQAPYFIWSSWAKTFTTKTKHHYTQFAEKEKKNVSVQFQSLIQ